MSAIYDQIANDPALLISYNQNGINSNYYPNYPDCNSVTILGPTYLPRIYGLNLTALEIASSGTIDLTLNDTYSIGISRSNYVNAQNFQTSIISQSNYSLELIANSNALSNDLYIQMDAYSNNINIVAASNVLIESRNGNITLDAGLGEIITISSNTFAISSGSNINLLGQNVNIFGVSSSNMGLTMCNTTDNTSLFALSNVIVTGSNNVYVNAINNQTYTSGSNISFYITQQSNGINPTLQISSNAVLINANLDITGTINTTNLFYSNVYHNSLNITDTQLHLAVSGSNDGYTGLPYDGPSTNDKSGVFIDGTPQTVTNSNLWPAYQKSLLWNYGTGNGTKDLGTSNVSTESYFEMQGGSFRLTLQNTSNNAMAPPVSFVLRINELEELEIVKVFTPVGSNAPVYKRISRFGRIL